MTEIVTEEKHEIKGKIAGIEIPPDLKKYNFYALFWCSMVMLMAITSGSVIQPIFLKDVIGIAPQNFGKISTALVVINEVASILLIGYVGVLSDRYGRRKIMTFGLVTSGITYIIFGYSKSIADFSGIEPIIAVFILRALFVIFLQFAWPHVFTIIGDYTYASSRGKGMAAIGLTSAIGALLAFGVISQIPKKFGVLAAFVTCGIIILISAAVSHFGVVDRMKVREKSEHSKGELELLMEAWQIVKDSAPLKMCYGAAFISRANVGVLGTMMMIWTAKVAQEYGHTTGEALALGGMAVGLSGIFGMITAPLWGILTDRWGRMRTTALSLAFTGIGYLLLTLIINPFGGLMKIFIIFIGAGQFGAMTASMTLATDLSPKKVLGSVLGGFNTFGALGIFVLTSVGGIVFDAFGHTSPFLIAGLVNIVVTVWCLVVYFKYGEKRVA
ncbi:MAG: MFS transporter [Candidatus Schekmanbacteria bacterium]|nr:MFS transporter [Candidatus Schekmanbacteria bacterium]